MSTKNGYQLQLTNDFKNDDLIDHQSQIIYLDDYKTRNLQSLNDNQFVQQLAHLANDNCYQDFRCETFYQKPKPINTIPIELNQNTINQEINTTIKNWLANLKANTNQNINTVDKFDFSPHYNDNGINSFYYESDYQNSISIYIGNSYQTDTDELLDQIKTQLIGRHHLSENNQTIYYVNQFKYQSGLSTVIVASNNPITNRITCLIPLRSLNPSANAKLTQINYRFNNHDLTQITDYPLALMPTLQNKVSEYSCNLLNTDIEKQTNQLEPLIQIEIPIFNHFADLSQITGMDDSYQNRIELLKTNHNYQQFVKNLK